MPTPPATHPSRVRVKQRLLALSQGMFVVLGALLLAVVAMFPAAAVGSGSTSVSADGARTTASTGAVELQRLVVLAGTRAQTSATTPCSIDDFGFTLPMPVVGTEYVRLGLDVLVGDVRGSCHDSFSSSTPRARHDRAPPSGAAKGAHVRNPLW